MSWFINKFDKPGMILEYGRLQVSRNDAGSKLQSSNGSKQMV